ncbi:MAG: FUSC family protein, partial [Sphingobacterium sp.]
SGLNTFEMAKERIFDTLLGGLIAFISSYVIFPSWESFQIRSNMRKLLVADYNYLAHAVRILSGESITVTDYKLARKELYIASANMGSTFQRVLSEPKWRQKSSKEVNRFVILNHIVSSYGATLLIRLHEAADANYIKDHLIILKSILNNIARAVEAIPIEEEDQEPLLTISEFPELTPDTLDLQETQLITEQLQFLKKISSDLQKATQDVMDKEPALIPQKLETANGKYI